MKSRSYEVGSLPNLKSAQAQQTEGIIMLRDKERTDKTHQIRIHIHQEPYESPSPTTGQALYILGKIPKGFDLYSEVRGDREDTASPNGPEALHLSLDEHFHRGEPHKTHFTVIVNGRPKEVTTDTLSFAQVVSLSGLPSNPNTIFTVTYKH